MMKKIVFCNSSDDHNLLRCFFKVWISTFFFFFCNFNRLITLNIVKHLNFADIKTRFDKNAYVV